MNGSGCVRNYATLINQGNERRLPNRSKVYTKVNEHFGEGSNAEFGIFGAYQVCFIKTVRKFKWQR